MWIYFIYLALYYLLYCTIVRNTTSYTSEENYYRKQKQYSIILAVGLILLFGLRASTVGIDTKQYLVRYQEYEYMLSAPGYASEFGFNYINAFFNKIGFSWQLYLFTISTVVITILVYFFRRFSYNVYFSFFFYVTIGGFTMALSGLRQTLAASICLISFIIMESEGYSKEKKRSKKIYIFAIALWLCAITIHNSAVVFFLFFLVEKIRLNKKSVMALSIISVASYFYGGILLRAISIFIPMRYANMTLDQGYRINPLLILISFLIPVFCAVFSREEDGRYDTVESTLYWFSIFNILFTTMSIYNNQLGRMIYYFCNANTILIANTITRMNRNNKIISGGLIGLMCLLYFYLGTKGGTLQIDQYTFFWNLK